MVQKSFDSGVDGRRHGRQKLSNGLTILSHGMTVAGFRDKDIYVIESLKYDIYQLSIHPSILQLPIVL